MRRALLSGAAVEDEELSRWKLELPEFQELTHTFACRGKSLVTRHAEECPTERPSLYCVVYKATPLERSRAESSKVYSGDTDSHSSTLYGYAAVYFSGEAE